MLTFSYQNSVRIIKFLPFCPVPKAIGLSNIPRDDHTVFVYNHHTARVEPLFVALAAPSDPPVRFFIDAKVVDPGILAETRKDVRNSIFSSGMQEKWGRHALTRKILERITRFLTRFMIANLNRYNFIPVFVHEPQSAEELAGWRRFNRGSIEDCLQSLENKIPVAIAPSGGYTHQETIRKTVPTTLPTLAQLLQRRGKTLKIVPTVVKEEPPLGFTTYKTYLADRILPYRLFRLLLDRLGIKRYVRPVVTVEFLPPVTFPHVNSSKAQKVEFVRHLQKIMYDVLNKD